MILQKIIKIVLSLPILLMGCEPMVVQDPIDPRIPKYTESGYNVAGAFINQNVWKSVTYWNKSNVWITSLKNSDSLIIRFDGQQNNSPLTISFYLKGYTVSKFQELVNLNDTKILLDGEDKAGVLETSSVMVSYSPKAIKGKGQLYFKHVQVDITNKTAVISGTFGFTTNDLTEVSYGRFDYAVKDSIGFVVQ